MLRVTAYQALKNEIFASPEGGNRKIKDDNKIEIPKVELGLEEKLAASLDFYLYEAKRPEL